MDLYWQLFFSSIRQHTRWPRDWSSRRVLFRSLKNAIDWFSRGDLTMQNKPTFIIGASMGALGTVRAQMHLRDILMNPALAPNILPGNEVYIGAVHEKLDENGRLTDQATIDFLDNVVNNFVEFYNKTKAPALA